MTFCQGQWRPTSDRQAIPSYVTCYVTSVGGQAIEWSLVVIIASVEWAEECLYQNVHNQ